MPNNVNQHLMAPGADGKFAASFLIILSLKLVPGSQELQSRGVVTDIKAP